MVACTNEAGLFGFALVGGGEPFFTCRFGALVVGLGGGGDTERGGGRSKSNSKSLAGDLLSLPKLSNSSISSSIFRYC